MKKVAVLSTLLILFAVTVIINNPLASVPAGVQDYAPVPVDQAASQDPLRSEAPIPSPSTLLLIGSGLIGLIIYRKKYKDRK